MRMLPCCVLRRHQCSLIAGACSRGRRRLRRRHVGRRVATCAGSSTTTRAPPPASAASIQAAPPCSATSSRTTESPIPLPPVADSALAVEAHVRLPHAIAIGGGNAGTLVLDPESHPRAMRRRAAAAANGDRLACRSVLGGVVEQVEQDLTKRVAIGAHRQAGMAALVAPTCVASERVA